MRPHPRIRKTIKWVRGGGAAVTALLVVVWSASLFFGFKWVKASGVIFQVNSGALVLERVSDPRLFSLKQMAVQMPTTEGVYFGYLGFHSRWWGFLRTTPPDQVLVLPLWMPLVAIGLPTFLLWRRDARDRRRERVGRCPKCNYDRAGLAPDAVCPECGGGGSAAA